MVLHIVASPTTVDGVINRSFRTCFPQKDSDKHRTFANELLAHQPYDSSDCPPDQGLLGQSSRESGNPPQPFVRKRRKPQVARSPGPNRKRARRTPWSKEEDDALREGYRQYGFQWTAIAKDPSLGLVNRSGNQVRDRFRLKYAHVYGGEGARCQAAGGDAVFNSVEGNSNTQAQSAEGNGTLKNMNDSDGVRATIDESGSDCTSDEGDRNEPLSPKRSTAVSRPSAAAPFDITNILNDEDEDNRPSATFRYDGWGENVTLPPLLLWEDIATRPMFELE